MNQAIIIGAGKTTYSLIEYIEELGYVFSDCFRLCLDNDSSLWGTEICGITIEAIEKIKDYPEAEIVISSIYEKDIRDQLTGLNFQGQIRSYKDYKRKLMINSQIKRYNRIHPLQIEKVGVDIKELTVYTVIIGKYDYLREIVNPDKSIKYICFTDDRSLHSNTWEVCYVNREFDDPIMESRKYKMLPQLFLDTEYSLYIDANIQLIKSPLEYVKQYFRRGYMLLLPHPDRDCIYKEMAACVNGSKDISYRLIKQAYIYSECGCPEHAGLFYGGLIGRRHFEEGAVAFGEKWWEHFQKYSRRDQISLGYLIWERNVEISLADINLCNNDWFAVDGKHRESAVNSGKRIKL